MENPDNEIELISFGVSLRLEKNTNNSNNIFVSILDYNGYSIIELTPKEIKELKKFVSKL
jgi:spermidine/putrescine-binding protein